MSYFSRFFSFLVCFDLVFYCTKKRKLYISIEIDVWFFLWLFLGFFFWKLIFYSFSRMNGDFVFNLVKIMQIILTKVIQFGCSQFNLNLGLTSIFWWKRSKSFIVILFEWTFIKNVDAMKLDPLTSSPFFWRSCFLLTIWQTTNPLYCPG